MDFFFKQLTYNKHRLRWNLDKIGRIRAGKFCPISGLFYILTGQQISKAKVFDVQVLARTRLNFEQAYKIVRAADNKYPYNYKILDKLIYMFGLN